MNPDQLNRIDLNLLVAFNALMEERNVSRAAERLHVTQPAMSKTLQRLRDLFNDQLFVRTPKGLEPTPKSIELQQPITKALDQLIQVLTPADFDPSRLERTFTIASSDPFSALFVPTLMQRLSEEAPGVRLRLVHYSGESHQGLSKGTLDFVCGIVTENMPAGLHGRKLVDDEICVFVRKTHPLAEDGQVSIQQLTEYGHIKPWFKGINDSGVLDMHLKSVGLTRTINLEASHFTTIRSTLINSEYMLLGLKNSWLNLLGSEEVVALELSGYSDQLFSIHLFWDERNHNDPASKWIRDLIVDISTDEIERIKQQVSAS